jgi:hypothetical protein
MDSPDFTRGNIIGMIVAPAHAPSAFPNPSTFRQSRDLIDTGDPLFPCEDKESKADQERLRSLKNPMPKAL